MPPPDTAPPFPPGPPDTSAELPAIVLATMRDGLGALATLKKPLPLIAPPPWPAFDGPWPPRASATLLLTVELTILTLATAKKPPPETAPPALPLPPTAEAVLSLTLLSRSSSEPLITARPAPEAEPPATPG